MFDLERKKVNGGCRSLCFEELPLLLRFHKYLYHYLEEYEANFNRIYTRVDGCLIIK
jgi:hypothetical protein